MRCATCNKAYSDGTISILKFIRKGHVSSKLRLYGLVLTCRVYGLLAMTYLASFWASMN